MSADTTPVDLLLKVALLGLLYKQDEDSEKIFDTLRIIVQQNPTPMDMLRAMVYLARTDFAKAEEILRAVLEQDPDNDLAKSSLGVVLQVSGKEGWEQMFGGVLSSSLDPTARQIATEGVKIGQIV